GRGTGGQDGRPTQQAQDLDEQQRRVGADPPGQVGDEEVTQTPGDGGGDAEQDSHVMALAVRSREPSGVPQPELSAPHERAWTPFDRACRPAQPATYGTRRTSSRGSER